MTFMAILYFVAIQGKYPLNIIQCIHQGKLFFGKSDLFHITKVIHCIHLQFICQWRPGSSSYTRAFTRVCIPAPGKKQKSLAFFFITVLVQITCKAYLPSLLSLEFTPMIIPTVRFQGLPAPGNRLTRGGYAHPDEGPELHVQGEYVFRWHSSNLLLADDGF